MATHLPCACGDAATPPHVATVTSRYPLPANSMLSHTRSTGSTDQRSRPRLKAIEIPDTYVRSPQVVEGWAMRPRADTASSVGSLGSPTLRD